MQNTKRVSVLCGVLCTVPLDVVGEQILEQSKIKTINDASKWKQIFI